MGQRTRSAVAAVGVLVFLAAYIVAAITVSGLLPNLPWVRLLFFAVVGVLWGVPLFPLLAWAEKGRRRGDDA